MNPEDKRKVKVGIAIAAFAIVFYLILQNFSKVTASFKYVVGIFNAFIIGLCIAFVLNLLMTFFENRVFYKIDLKKHPKFARAKRPISILLTVIIVLGILTGLIWFIIPQLTESVATLGRNMNSYIMSLEQFGNNILNQFGISADINKTINGYLTEISTYIIDFIKNAVPKIFEVTSNITTGIVNIFLGFIIGIYMLAGKETLLRNCKKTLYAFAPKKGADYFLHVYQLVKVRFSGFVTGQLTEAVILCVLCFIGMNIFGMQYALLISVIIGVTNMIPIIGPIVGAIPGAIIMLMIDPMKALWFVIFIIVLQQLESNIIYPKIVGDSIGLPGIWVIFAIMLGGKLFGFAGIILGVPAFAVLYTILSENVTAKLKKKGITVR
ncbi:AI-2E family transporter [Paludicola sp. MB14-C6]|uniref:AI-2E family transporter n=1 Tax=Paludihabitans sp. MB14-C6 TaxID=3070656 RepID=UPI0027DBE76B|nr:AI-2E family transporter [Paludicola sp. MB14-C6]WMJ24269.1 AI-2E family transporter [Paludicola sp. MB14-C6]